MADPPYPTSEPEPSPGSLTGEAAAATRHGPRVILVPPEVQAQIDLIEHAVPAVRSRRPIVGAIWSLGLGMVGAAVWAVVTVVSGVHFGLVALLIGILAGMGARKGGSGRAAQWTGAICAAVAYMAGQMACLLGMSVMYYKQHHPRGSTPAMRSTAPAASQVNEVGSASPAAVEDEEDILVSSQPASRPAIASTRPAAEVGALLFAFLKALLLGSLQVTAEPLELLFLGLAVYEGYRIPRG